MVLEQFPPFPPILATRIGWDLLGNIDMNLGMDEGGILREEEEEEEEEEEDFWVAIDLRIEAPRLHLDADCGSNLSVVLARNRESIESVSLRHFRPD